MTGRDFWKAFFPVLGLLIVFALVFFFLYRYEFGYGNKTPTIEVISGNEIVTNKAEVPITGVVRDTDALTVDGKEVPVSGDGSFSTTVPISLGESTIVIVAGKEKQATANIRVTREEVAKAVKPTEVVSGGSVDLSTNTGPVSNVMGAIGLASILVSLYIYRRSVLQKTLQNA